MKQEPAHRSHRLAALFAAAAFLPTPLLAQTATPQNSTPPVSTQTQPPVAETQPPVVDEPAPVLTQPPPVTTQTPPVTEQPRPPVGETPVAAEAPAAAPARRTERRATRTASPAPRAASRPPVQAAPAARAAAPAPAEAAPSPEAVPAEALAPEAIPPADAPPAALPAAAAPPEAAPAPEQDGGGGANWLWAVAGAAILIGALAYFLRRRRARERYDANDEPVHAYSEAPAAVEPERHTLDQPEAAPVHASAAAAAFGAAAGASAAEQGRPWLELLMRPVRAGVEGKDAIVEFELAVDNQGAAPARDVRVSTWMFPAGAAQSEMERMLIERPPAATMPEVALDPGESRRIHTAVALPTGGLAEDAVLPVVVADARYVLPDGSEGRTSVCYAVGVPDGEELAHFAIDNPSGLHEGVEARPMGDPERE